MGWLDGVEAAADGADRAVWMSVSGRCRDYFPHPLYLEYSNTYKMASQSSTHAATTRFDTDRTWVAAVLKEAIGPIRGIWAWERPGRAFWALL